MGHLYWRADGGGNQVSVIPLSSVSLRPVLLALAIGGAAGALCAWLHTPLPWLIGPLVVAVGLSAAGVSLSAVPGWIVNLGQVFIGIALGTRFAPGFFDRAPRVLVVVAVSTLLAIAASAGFAWLLARWSGVPWATLALATSPGGIAEMALTAKLLELGVPMVTLFHLTRVLMLVLFGGAMYRWLAPRFGWPADEVPVPARPPRDDENE